MIDPKDWTLLSVPNNNDKVGTVFSIDKKGKKYYLGNLDIKTQASSAALTQRFENKNIGADILFSFLKVPVLDSTDSANISLGRTIKTSFAVNSPTMTRYDDDLLSAFNLGKQKIIDNIKFLKQNENPVYLVTETLSSSNVNILFDKKAQTQGQLKSIITRVLGLNANVRSSSSDSSILTYNLSESLILFYQLNPIDIEYQGGKGDLTKPIDIKLSANTVRKDAL